jgi:Na+/proline symporter
MHLGALDIAVIVVFFALNLGIGAYYARRGGSSMGEYFLSGRNVPWWLAGTSMVATTFAADTPLAVTGFVAQHGIAGNWVWWSSLMSGILTVFFFARMWRRAGVYTDVEFTEIRYGGRPAAALRFTRAAFQGLVINTIIMGWVNVAMAKILFLTLHVQKFEAIVACLVLTAAYVSIGGLWSVLVTDLLQFVVKMSMAIVLAVAAVAAVGGMPGLTAHLAEIDRARAATGAGSVLDFLPNFGAAGAWMPLGAFAAYVGVAWWASSYPGAEPGGGGYIAQRIFAAKTERDGLFATLFFNVAHYALRPWPWILVALAALVLYPAGVLGANGKVDAELGYVQVMIDHLPVWLRGVMMAGFLAAYMSTIGTHLNLGASYLTNDLYRRFFVKTQTDKHYVLVSRLMTLGVMLLSIAVTTKMDSVGGAWIYLLNVTAGIGLVMILRWYWSRINAWSEIAALVTSFVCGSAITYFRFFGNDTDPLAVPKSLVVTVAVTTVVWLAVTFATRPESDAVLEAFHRRVRPSGPGWTRIAARTMVPPGESLRVGLIEWIAGVALVYGALFGIGKVVLGDYAGGAIALGIAIAAGFVIARGIRADDGVTAAGAIPAALR